MIGAMPLPSTTISVSHAPDSSSNARWVGPIRASAARLAAPALRDAAAYSLMPFAPSSINTFAPRRPNVPKIEVRARLRSAADTFLNPLASSCASWGSGLMLPSASLNWRLYFSMYMEACSVGLIRVVSTERIVVPAVEPLMPFCASAASVPVTSAKSWFANDANEPT